MSEIAQPAVEPDDEHHRGPHRDRPRRGGTLRVEDRVDGHQRAAARAR